ncbi:MAG: DUF4197 domain-containing protein [Gammaproteobacteria bacterium]|nr:MAG: DUF4197 domain-containing protein [Gammaproteobacteria bacterium]
MSRYLFPLLLSMAFPAQAGWRDLLGDFMGDGQAQEVAGAALSGEEVTQGLREALATGAKRAVRSLGRPGGFLDNPKVRIPLPGKLGMIGDALSRIGQGEKVDAFIASMNHAAEQAVPKATDIFIDAISKMSFEDARRILEGPDDAATRYLQRSASADLEREMLPLVSDATSAVGVTRRYKELLAAAGPVARLAGDSLDLDRYVTGKALEGLFLVLAEEEARIRHDPVARSSELLRKVFGD